VTWKEDALIHAKNVDPTESCGLLLNIKGKEKYYPCHNLSTTADQCFIIDPEDYIKGSNLGDITAIVHSHPISRPVASQADKISCEQGNFLGILLIQKQKSGDIMNHADTNHLYLVDLGCGV
tara:strand:- start:327 stop:692 length:366 start_codon:yes stop_codon:yes gene_type:complete